MNAFDLATYLIDPTAAATAGAALIWTGLWRRCGPFVLSCAAAIAGDIGTLVMPWLWQTDVFVARETISCLLCGFAILGILHDALRDGGAVRPRQTIDLLLTVAASATAAYLWLSLTMMARGSYRGVALLGIAVAALALTALLLIRRYPLPVHPIAEWVLGAITLHRLVQAIAFAQCEWSLRAEAGVGVTFTQWAFRIASVVFVVSMLLVSHAAFRYAGWSLRAELGAIEEGC